jgi:hypothetical protein
VKLNLYENRYETESCPFVSFQLSFEFQLINWIGRVCRWGRDDVHVTRPHSAANTAGPHRITTRPESNVPERDLVCPYSCEVD